MADKETTSVFELYSKASHAWLDIFSSWARMAESLSPAFRGMDTGMWFRPYWNYIEDWSKAYQGFADMTRTMPYPSKSMRDASETATRGVNSYVKAYDTWLRGMNAIVQESYEINRKLSAGEEAETRKLFDTMKDTYDNLAAVAVETTRDTPFAGVKEIDDAVKRSRDSFSVEQHMIQDTFRELFNFTVKVMNLSASAMSRLPESLVSLMGQSTISTDSYKNIMDSYGQALKTSFERMQLLSQLLPRYSEVIDDSIAWSKANLDLYVSWLEVDYNLYQGATRSAGEVYRITGEAFREGGASSLDDFYRRWSDTYWKTMESLVKSSRVYETTPRFINSYTGWMKATNRMYRSLLTIPYAVREEMEKGSGDLREEMKEELRKMSGEIRKVSTDMRKMSEEMTKVKQSICIT